MSSEPLVSIITPTYNHQKFIGPCIESVIRQTYPYWEQIIIDDGSTDNTAEVIRGFTDPRIRYVYQENAGIEALAHSYNRALSMCNGELIAILEGDDLWPSEKLAALTPAFSDESVVVAYGAVGDVATDGAWDGRLARSVRARMKLPEKILFNEPPGTATRYMLRPEGVDLIPPSAVMIRRTALISIGGFQYFPDLCVTDFPTFVSLSLAGKFYYTPSVMGYRRRHLGSATYQNLTRILTRAHEYVRAFPAEHGFRLSLAEREEIERVWNRPRPSLEFTVGRLSLMCHDWARARSHFSRALHPREPLILLAAATGWLASWIHCDIERVARIFGVANLSPDN